MSNNIIWKLGKYETDSVVFTHSYPKGVSNEFIEGKAAEITVGDGRLVIVLSTKK